MLKQKAFTPVRNKSDLSDDSQDSESIKAPCGSSNGLYVNRGCGPAIPATGLIPGVWMNIEIHPHADDWFC